MPEPVALGSPMKPRTPVRRIVNRVRDSACRRATGGRTVRAVRAGAARGTCQGWSEVIASEPRTSRRRRTLGVAASRGPTRRGPLATGLACSASLASWSSTRTAPNGRDRVRCPTTCQVPGGTVKSRCRYAMRARRVLLRARGACSVNCREVQEEFTAGLPAAADLAETTGRQAGTCAAEQASLRQVGSLRGPAR
jgi:hypothetical protein